MSDYLVIDSSFIMSDILPDEDGSEHDLATYSVYVPAIFFLECNNVLNGAFKRKRITVTDLQEYLQLLGHLPFTVDKFSATPECLHIISRLCQQYDLTSYDACYLELALRLEATLGTHDKKLMAAGKESGVNILSVQ